MNISGKKVFVTGADGFIGSHLVEALVQHGCQVKALCYYNSFNSQGWLDHIPQQTRQAIEIVAGDVRDSFAMKAMMQGCEIVFHLAALIGIPYSYQAPEAYVDTNIKGTLNILQAARELGTERIIHTSTSEVYGTAQFVPITELHPLQGQSPYSASKIAADQLAYSFYQSFDVPVTTIRPFNTYGPRQSARAVIPTVITQIAAGESSIKLGNLNPTRDFNYVSDTVAGFIAGAESDCVLGEVLNLGSNFEVSIADTVHMIKGLMHSDIDIQTESHRLRPEGSEVDRLLADNNKALKLLDWRPEYASLEGMRKGLQQTIEWFSQTDNLQYYNTKNYIV